MKNKNKWFWIVAGLLVIDLFVPDPVPIIDEVILGILTGYFYNKKKK